MPVRPSCPIRRWLHAVLVCCLFLGLPIWSAHAQFTRFENYTDDQGVGNATVFALGQDAEGYILLGTEAGLYRHDGSSTKPYDVGVGLPSEAWIRKIMTDEAGRIWVVTKDDLYVRYGARFSRVDLGMPLDLRSPHLVAVADGYVVIDNAGHLLRAAVGPRAVGTFLPVLGPAALKTSPDMAQARFVLPEAGDTLLIGCGTTICRVRNGQTTALGAADGLPADTWLVAIRAPDGTIWTRSLGRLAWRRPGKTSFVVVDIPTRSGLSYARISTLLDLLPDTHGGVMTQGGDGLLDWDGTAWRSYAHHDGGLAASPIQALLRDREGSLWVGTMGHGAFRSIGLGTWEHWTADDGLPSDLVWGMTRLRGGQLWVATYGNTVALDGKADGIPGGSPIVQASRDGRLWAAPLDAPLVRFDPINNTAERFPLAVHVSTTFVDSDNRLWLCSSRALYVVENADALAASVHVDLALPYGTFQVAPDLSGTIWALTRNGLFRRNPTGRFVLVSSVVLPEDQDGGMAFAPNGDLWVFTESRGISRFHPTVSGLEPLSSITAPVIGSNSILFLHRDRRGWMWVGTDHGIDMFNGNVWRRFDKDDGLISNDMDQWAIYEDADGSMWFGTSHGLTHLVDPTNLPRTTTLHPRITGLSIGSRNLVLSPSVRTNWSSASTVIRFADLDFARGNITFRYRLHGLDAGWNDTTSHDVRYAGLPAGEFRFELVAVDAAHGVVSEPVAFTIHIRAPWWRRWWFYGLSMLAAATAFAAAWQARIRLLLRQQRRLEGMVGARTAEIEQARKELQRLAMSDVLTGLPNRRAIMGGLEEAVATALRSQTSLAVLLCDIDHFKKINDGFGHLAGDAVLSAFGNRLGAVIGPLEAVGRYGGEEFLMILPGSEEAVMKRVACIRSAISDAPYTFGDGERTVTASGGVAFLRSSDTPVSLVARADIALYEAKEAGRNRIEKERSAGDEGEQARKVIATAGTALTRRRGSRAHPMLDHEAQLDEPSQERRDLERDLRAALAEEQLVLHYQPVVDAELDVVTSCEALLRWRSPTRGNVSPASFIPFAEEIGLMPEIGDWVLRAACSEAAGWQKDMKVSVNLSPSQFHLPDLVERIVTILNETGLPPTRLELEVTETAMIDDVAAATSLLERITALGITIALDDFGTGYSSLSFLRTLPFNRIKIDRSFVQDLGVRPEATAIVRAISGLCDSLNAAVTAEGVESPEQIELLRALGCREIQGFLIARPCPPAELRVWMDAFAASHVLEPAA